MSYLANIQTYPVLNRHNASYPAINRRDISDPCPVKVFPCMTRIGRALKVEGKGRVMAVPDEAVIVLGVSTENIQLEAAQRENALRVTSVINALTALGVPVENIQTQTYQIQPKYDFIDGKQVFRGYSVIHNLRVVIKNIGMVGRAVDAAVAAGANTVNEIVFTVSDQSGYYDAALNAAISDATAKAASVGRKLNVYVSPVPVQIVEKTYQAGMPVPYTAMQTIAPATPIQPGQIEISALIEAIFSYGV